MKKEDKDLIIDLLFTKYKENRDKKILDLIKKIEKINFVAELINLENSHINIKDESSIDWTDLFMDELDLSNMHLEMTNKKIKVIGGK